MATKEELQWQLAALKEAVNKSSDIKEEVKNLFKKFTIANFEGGPVILEKDNAFSLYTLRYQFKEKKGVYNESWAKLLKRLATADIYAHITISALTIDDKAYIFFSDNDYKECFGVIY